MNNEIKFLLLLLSLGFIFFTCKKDEPASLPENDFRDELVGTYILVCTKEQTFPYNPTLIYPVDTTDIGKEIEVTYDPTDEIDEDGNGKVHISNNLGGTVSLSPYANGYSFSYPWISHGQSRFNSVRFISPDSIYRAWESPASPIAEYRYECRGSKIQ